jgi:hypothetical protein
VGSQLLLEDYLTHSTQPLTWLRVRTRPIPERRPGAAKAEAWHDASNAQGLGKIPFLLKPHSTAGISPFLAHLAAHPRPQQRRHCVCNLQWVIRNELQFQLLPIRPAPCACRLTLSPTSPSTAIHFCDSIYLHSNCISPAYGTGGVNRGPVPKWGKVYAKPPGPLQASHASSLHPALPSKGNK